MNHFSRLKLILGIFFFLLPLPSWAAEGSLNLITSPLPINLSTTPGSTISTPIKIKNGGTDTEQIKVNLMKFRAYESNGQPELLTPEAEDPSIQWVAFSENEFTAAPDEWRTIQATFTIPEEAAFGYYYAVVFSRSNEQVPTETKETYVQGGTAVLVLLDVKVPDAKREVTVETFTADKKMYEFLPATFTIKLKNTGNVHVAPRGNIFINRGDEKDIAILEINQNKGNILPDSNRDFSVQWSDGFPVYQEKKQDGKVILDENGQQQMELKWDFGQASKLRWGKYTAKMLLIYDDGQRDIPVEGEISFWVMPWRVIFGTIGILIAFFLLGRLSTKIRFSRK